MMEITVGKFYERQRGIDDWWIVMPVSITKRIVTFRDVQKLDNPLHTCSPEYFRTTFKEIKRGS